MQLIATPFLFGEGNRQRGVEVRIYRSGPLRNTVIWEVPVFKTNANGSIIYLKNMEYAMSAIRITESTEAQHLSDTLIKLIDKYNNKIFMLTNASEPDVTIIKSADKKIEIRGDFLRAHIVKVGEGELAPLAEYTNECERKLWLALPSDIRELLKRIIEFSDKTAKPWMPDTIRLVMRIAGPALENPIKWPANLPNNFTSETDDPNTMIIDVPATYFDEIFSTITLQGKSRAILLNGKRMYAQVYISW